MNKPHWWTDAHTTMWERTKEALRRDWDQTKRDLHLGGHELNQDLDDTIAQAAGGKPIPSIDVPNPPKVIGRWEDVQMAIGFGYAARTYFGDRHPAWDNELERQLRADWHDSSKPWDRVRLYVRHGYELRH